MTQRSMFDCALTQYTVAMRNREWYDVRFSVLVNCQQMIEMVCKGILEELYGEYPRTHDIRFLVQKVDKNLAIANRAFLVEITDWYFTQRYASDNYYDYSIEEFNDVVDKCFALYNLLLSYRKSGAKESNFFR
ncbi:HEPN domain-containing protein [Clostridium paraputrificum]|uniref:HEPN domain protein n=1 Tax=Clostridium paraputrificum TaxID=29363 RepID=A0A6N3F8E2_9CLOT